jgi:hypothetical protein
MWHHSCLVYMRWEILCTDPQNNHSYVDLKYFIVIFSSSGEINFKMCVKGLLYNILTKCNSNCPSSFSYDATYGFMKLLLQTSEVGVNIIRGRHMESVLRLAKLFLFCHSCILHVIKCSKCSKFPTMLKLCTSYYGIVFRLISYVPMFPWH